MEEAYKQAIRKTKVRRSFSLDKSVSDKLDKLCKENDYVPSYVVNEILNKHFHAKDED